MSWEDTGRIPGGYREDIGRILGGYFCFFDGIPRNSCRIREGYREDTGRILGGYWEISISLLLFVHSSLVWVTQQLQLIDEVLQVCGEEFDVPNGDQILSFKSLKVLSRCDSVRKLIKAVFRASPTDQQLLHDDYDFLGEIMQVYQQDEQAEAERTEEEAEASESGEAGPSEEEGEASESGEARPSEEAAEATESGEARPSEDVTEDAPPGEWRWEDTRRILGGY